MGNTIHISLTKKQVSQGWSLSDYAVIIGEYTNQFDIVQTINTGLDEIPTILVVTGEVDERIEGLVHSQLYNVRISAEGVFASRGLEFPL